MVVYTGPPIVCAIDGPTNVVFTVLANVSVNVTDAGATNDLGEAASNRDCLQVI